MKENIKRQVIRIKRNHHYVCFTCRFTIRVKGQGEFQELTAKSEDTVHSEDNQIIMLENMQSWKKSIIKPTAIKQRRRKKAGYYG